MPKIMRALNMQNEPYPLLWSADLKTTESNEDYFLDSLNCSCMDIRQRLHLAEHVAEGAIEIIQEARAASTPSAPAKAPPAPSSEASVAPIPSAESQPSPGAARRPPFQAIVAHILYHEVSFSVIEMREATKVRPTSPGMQETSNGLHAAHRIFQQMASERFQQEGGQMANSIPYAKLITAFADNRMVDRAMEVYEWVKKEVLTAPGMLMVNIQHIRHRTTHSHTHTRDIERLRATRRA
ncbi:unnamed protein product [Vitrella brassicaformis CCMP3155]|uniref:Uncharacterized protein n=1 Tax=Vitrella brassicaformis (strain CCMP3155) TaxID=1169540 RepID=A0A0G4ETM1_VITBC|nr:unnamed protein product [Vitrella brassicaformis CCMP3155]|eukprot:CEM01009.1 unnamed protein product [Vitrella brassicaformis CCMP3155]